VKIPDDDQAIANLLSMVAVQYQKQAGNALVPINQTRFEIIRKLELITQSIKGLMKYGQAALPPDET
jgi:hypothetical protein